LTHYISAVDRAIPDVSAAVDSTPWCVQSGRKSFVWVWKWRHSRRSNLRDRVISALVGKNLSPRCPLLELGNGCR